MINTSTLMVRSSFYEPLRRPILMGILTASSLFITTAHHWKMKDLPPAHSAHIPSYPPCQAPSRAHTCFGAHHLLSPEPPTHTHTHRQGLRDEPKDEIETSFTEWDQDTALVDDPHLRKSRRSSRPGGAKPSRFREVSSPPYRSTTYCLRR